MVTRAVSQRSFNRRSIFYSVLTALSLGFLGACSTTQEASVELGAQVRTLAYPSTGNQVTVYQLGNYDTAGQRSVPVGTYRLSNADQWPNVITDRSQSDSISGITVPDGLRATLCDSRHYPYGRCRVFEAGNYPFIGQGMNDVTSFIQVSEAPLQVSIYTDRDFLGYTSTYIKDEFSGLGVGVWTPSNNGPAFYWNDSISSLQVPPGLRVRACENSDGGGACQVFEAGDHVYTGDALNDRISRLEITSVPKKNFVTVYEDASFLGKTQAFGIGQFSVTNGGYSQAYFGVGQLAMIGNDTVSSLRVPTGLTVKICDNSNGSGTCSIYTAGDYPSVGGMNDRTSYIQVY
jgi:hypothetical protein